MYIFKNSDILFRFGQISVCKCIPRGINTSYFISCFKIWLTRNMENKTEKVWNLHKAFSLRIIQVCRFEIMDGVKYVFCIKHAHKYLLREQVGFAAVL